MPDLELERKICCPADHPTPTTSSILQTVRLRPREERKWATQQVSGKKQENKTQVS